MAALSGSHAPGVDATVAGVKKHRLPSITSRWGEGHARAGGEGRGIDGLARGGRARHIARDVFPSEHQRCGAHLRASAASVFPRMGAAVPPEANLWDLSRPGNSALTSELKSCGVTLGAMRAGAGSGPSLGPCRSALRRRSESCCRQVSPHARRLMRPHVEPRVAARPGSRLIPRRPGQGGPAT